MNKSADQCPNLAGDERSNHDHDTTRPPAKTSNLYFPNKLSHSLSYLIGGAHTHFMGKAFKMIDRGGTV